jgi:hypothetical protein
MADRSCFPYTHRRPQAFVHRYSWRIAARTIACYVATVYIGCWLVAAGSVFSKSFEGVYLPDRLRLYSHVLELAACGVRDTLWIEHYVTAVYVQRGESLQALRREDQAKAVALHVVEDRYLPDEIPSRWRKALESTLAPTAMANVRQAYRTLRNGDIATVFYTPRRGVVLSVNGEPIVRTAGHAVISSILKAWAADEPLAAKLERLQREHSC